MAEVETLNSSSDAKEILALEHRRCRAIVARDMPTLSGLLGTELVHTHTRGNVQDRAQYLHYIEHEMVFQSVERTDLDVRLFGDAAVVTGRLTNVVRRREDAEFVRVEAQVLQVWVRSSGGWVQVAFQATALRPPEKVNRNP
jgi:hypothetical protein